jgi:BirA family transcriptional regulator, biotin operon repressor / biotin---[acetyl-CoA-carboxylase] ligase
LPKTEQRFEVPGRTVHWFESLGSTMTVAAELARHGCESGTVVVADEQTAGIGRHGHSWHSQRGGLYVSIVLRLTPPSPVMMLALGLAAREAIAGELSGAGLRPALPATARNTGENGRSETCPTLDLRWPNDVLLNGRKCAGVISQTESGPLKSDAVIAGIGINVSQTAFPEGVDATSLQLAGVATTREAVLRTLLEAVDRYCAEPPTEIRRMFEASSSYARGCRVRVEQGEFEGVTQGLDASGFLIVRQDDGREATILAGGVRPCC